MNFLSRPKAVALFVYLFFLFYLAIVLFTFRDYGITWDEDMLAEYGKAIASYYASGMQDQHLFHLGNLHFYGGAFEFPVALFNRISPWGEYETRHLLNALIGYAGVYGVYRFAWFLTGSRVSGLLGAVLLVLSPRYYGHSFNNPKDIPFAVFYLWSIYLICRWMDSLVRGAPPGKLAVGLGLAIGLAMGTRAPGLTLIFYLALGWLGAQLIRRQADRALPLREWPGSAVKSMGAPVALAFAAMFFLWPYSHRNPFVTIPLTLREMSRFQWNFPILFEGRNIMATEVPWYYVVKWYGIAVPFAQLAAFGLSLLLFTASVLSGIGQRTDGDSPAKKLSFGLALFGMAFPLGWAIASGSTLYDGLRHFLFLMPLMAVCGAWGCHSALERIASVLGLDGRRGLWLNAALTAALAASLAPAGQWMVRSHPNQYIYFNATVGGVKGAFGRYDTDYYMNSERQAVLWLNHYVGKQALPRKPRVCSYSRPVQTEYYLDKSILLYNPAKTVDEIGTCEIFIANLRWGVAPKGTVLHAIAVDETPLVYIVLNDDLMSTQTK